MGWATSRLREHLHCRTAKYSFTMTCLLAMPRTWMGWVAALGCCNSHQHWRRHASGHACSAFNAAPHVEDVQSGSAAAWDAVVLRAASSMPQSGRPTCPAIMGAAMGRIVNSHAIHLGMSRQNNRAPIHTQTHGGLHTAQHGRPSFPAIPPLCLHCQRSERMATNDGPTTPACLLVPRIGGVPNRLNLAVGGCAQRAWPPAGQRGAPKLGRHDHSTGQQAAGRAWIHHGTLAGAGTKELAGGIHTHVLPQPQ